MYLQGFVLLSEHFQGLLGGSGSCQRRAKHVPLCGQDNSSVCCCLHHWWRHTQLQSWESPILLWVGVKRGSGEHYYPPPPPPVLICGFKGSQSLGIQSYLEHKRQCFGLNMQERGLLNWVALSGNYARWQRPSFQLFWRPGQKGSKCKACMDSSKRQSIWAGEQGLDLFPNTERGCLAPSFLGFEEMVMVHIVVSCVTSVRTQSDPVLLSPALMGHYHMVTTF